MVFCQDIQPKVCSIHEDLGDLKLRLVNRKCHFDQISFFIASPDMDRTPFSSIPAYHPQDYTI